MSKRLMLSVIFASLLVGILIGYVQGVPADVVNESEFEAEIAVEYGYRCGDGSEFTLVPTNSMESIRIVPATSVDYVREANLKLMRDALGSFYEGEGIVLRMSASGLVLVSEGHATTTCTSMQSVDAFNLGA